MRAHFCILAIGSLALLGTSTLSGQDGCNTKQIGIGDSASGRLSAICGSRLRPGSYAARYSFSASAGQKIALQTLSSSVDTIVYLIDPQGFVLAQDDDGGVGNGSRIPRESGNLALPADGTYTIEVTSFQPETIGPFELQVTVPQGCTTTPIAAGTTATGQLTTSDCLSVDGNFYTDYYSFTGSPGQLVAFTMSSSVLDSYLVLHDPAGNILAEDDDSAGNLNARIPSSGFLSLTSSGTYIVEATTFREFDTGAYTLRFDTSGGSNSGGPFKFVTVTPCRVVDTRTGEGKSGAFGPPFLSAGTTRDVPIPTSGCDAPSNSAGYSLNITVVPRGPLSFLTVYPTGQTRPLASTLNSFDGKIVANAALVPAGTNGSITIYVTDNTDVIVDLNGYLSPQ